MEAELHSDACRGFKARIRQQADADDLFLAVSLELVFEVGVRKSARCPMLSCDDVTRLRLEVVVESPTPSILRKGLSLCSAELIRRRVFPVYKIARLPAMMRNVINFDPCLAGRPYDRAKIVEQVDLLGDVLDPRPELSSRTQKVVVEIDAQHRSDLGVVSTRHRTLLSLARFRHGWSTRWELSAAAEICASSTAGSSELIQEPRVNREASSLIGNLNIEVAPPNPNRWSILPFNSLAKASTIFSPCPGWSGPREDPSSLMQH